MNTLVGSGAGKNEHKDKYVLGKHEEENEGGSLEGRHVCMSFPVWQLHA